MIFQACANHPDTPVNWEAQIEIVKMLNGSANAEFTLFQKLPLGVRTRVWENVLPRIVYFSQGVECPSSRLHPLLHTNHEARKIALGWYRSTIMPPCGDFRACTPGTPRYAYRRIILLISHMLSYIPYREFLVSVNHRCIFNASRHANLKYDRILFSNLFPHNKKFLWGNKPDKIYQPIDHLNNFLIANLNEVQYLAIDARISMTEQALQELSTNLSKCSKLQDIIVINKYSETLSYEVYRIVICAGRRDIQVSSNNAESHLFWCQQGLRARSKGAGAAAWGGWHVGHRLLMSKSEGYIHLQIILVDNQGAIKLSKNPQHHSRTEHINVQYHFIRKPLPDLRLYEWCLSCHRRRSCVGEWLFQRRGWQAM